MTGIYDNIYKGRLLDKFIINRGYSLKSLQLIAIVYRRKINLDYNNNVEIILNYQEKALNFRTNKVYDIHKIESLCVVNIKYNGEMLFMVVKSLPNAKYIQCYLFLFEKYSEVFQITTFVNIQSVNMDIVPPYSTIFFETDLVLHNPLNSIMRSFEVEEVKILNIKSISSHQNENFPKNLMVDMTSALKVENDNCKLYNIYSFTNNEQDKTMTECDKSCYQHLTKSSRIYLVITTDISIQFLDTRLKKLTAEIFYIDLKEIIRQIDQLYKVLIITRNILNNHQYSLESLYLQFTDDNNCKKFVDILCTKGEIQYKSLRLCPNCPKSVINRFSYELNEETNDFQLDEFDKMEKYSVIRVKNLINSYLEKVEDITLNKTTHENIGNRIISIFETFLIHHEKLQSNHNCNLQIKDKVSRKGSLKIWENMKNLFNKKSPVENKSLESPNNFAFKDEENDNGKYEWPVNDVDGSLLRTITSKTRRAISVNESILQKPSIIAMDKEYVYKNDSFSMLSNTKLKKTFLCGNNLIEERRTKRSFRSIGFVILAARMLMKLSQLEWDFPTKNEFTKSNKFPINNNDIKSYFGPNESLSYSLNTMTNNSFEQINQQWDAIIKSNNRGIHCFHKIVTDGVGLLHRREVWKLLIRINPCIRPDKTLKYNLNSDFQKILEEMTRVDIFECYLVKDFYKQSFLITQRSNSDIINDVGRTMPQISYYGIQNTGQLALYNVLRAYALLDPEVAYCQGMNFIVAIFLIYMNEEEAFIALIFYMIFLERREIYLPSMIGIKHSFYKLERLVNDFCPALNCHLMDKDFPISLYASSWVMTLFVTTYPLHFVTRVFDMILAEGPSIIFNISITLISYVADKVLQLMEFDLIYEHFSKNLNNLSDDDLTQILHKASEVNIDRNLKIYDLEITCNVTDIVGDNEFIQQLCVENTDLRLENVIFRKKIETMQKEIMELKRLLINKFKNMDFKS